MKSGRSVQVRARKSDRALKVGEFLKSQIADLLRHKVRDPRLSGLTLSVVDVRISRDLAYADAYVACFESSDEKTERVVLGVLRRASGFFRSEIAKRHSMRATPEIRFHFDQTEAEAARIEHLLAATRPA